MKVRITGSETVYYSQVVEMSETDWNNFRQMVDDEEDDDVITGFLESWIDRTEVCNSDDLELDAGIVKEAK